MIGRCDGSIVDIFGKAYLAEIVINRSLGSELEIDAVFYEHLKTAVGNGLVAWMRRGDTGYKRNEITSLSGNYIHFDNDTSVRLNDTAWVSKEIGLGRTQTTITVDYAPALTVFFAGLRATVTAYPPTRLKDPGLIKRPIFIYGDNDADFL